jgi:hypothetical protein
MLVRKLGVAVLTFGFAMLPLASQAACTVKIVTTHVVSCTFNICTTTDTTTTTTTCT